MNGRVYVDGKLSEGELPPVDIIPIDQRKPRTYGDVAARPAEPKAAQVLLPTQPSVDEEPEITDTAGLRKFLLKQMQRAAVGKISSEEVRNTCAIVQQIYQATRLELDAAKILQDSTRSIRAIDLTGADGGDS